eukprot:m.1134 g.1134  ORF g.1134 m.1134 type:complete len:355 (+) comp5768_c0_seq1:49-1113(+)
MGSGASLSKVASHKELSRETERTHKCMVEADELLARQELEHAAKIDELRAEKERAEENLAQLREKMHKETEKWRKDKSEAVHMMFSELPLIQLSRTSQNANISSSMFSECSSSLCKEFSLVTMATWDVVGFAELCAQLKPTEIVNILDNLHSRASEIFSDTSIVILERSSDSCMVATGLVEEYTNTGTHADSSYGSEDELREPASELESADDYADLLATCCLRLMSSVSTIAIPRNKDSLLQLRIAVHSGFCSAGAIGLHSEHQAPKYRLFGPTVTMANWLCSTSLALQIRISSSCKELLAKRGRFLLERCPDYTLKSGQETVQSYWLTGIAGQPDIRLPPLEKALSLSKYSDF